MRDIEALMLTTRADCVRLSEETTALKAQLLEARAATTAAELALGAAQERADKEAVRRASSEAGCWAGNLQLIAGATLRL